jgi:2-methylcitrate dehydratase PrpD
MPGKGKPSNGSGKMSSTIVKVGMSEMKTHQKRCRWHAENAGAMGLAAAGRAKVGEQGAAVGYCADGKSLPDVPFSHTFKIEKGRQAAAMHISAKTKKNRIERAQ